MSFHVPLHGRGDGAPVLMRRGFQPLMQWDLTELAPLDDLHLSHHAIKDAQQLAARLFNAEETFFLVNGVTGGILALFLAFCSPGDKVLLTRISHKSALHGIALSGALPVYLPVEKDPPTGLPLNVSAKMVEEALQEHPDTKLILITSPSYWGITADLHAIRKIAIRYDAMLAVDEAHGTHFPFYRESLPHSSAAGVDIWLQSAHKSLGALTPGAFLHLGHKRFAPPVKFWLQALQTSSPSYPVMISLDLIRMQAALMGKKLFSKSWNWSLRLRSGLEKKGFRLLSPEISDSRDFKLDPCRITFFCPRGEGRLLARKLAKHRIEVEMCDDSYLLAVVGPSQLALSSDFVVRAITNARSEITSLSAPVFSEYSSFFFLRRTAAFVMSPQKALRSPCISVALEESVGKTSAEMVVLSPPGIPILSPGEEITEEAVSYLLLKRTQKMLFQGASNPTLLTIKVVAGDINMVE